MDSIDKELIDSELRSLRRDIGELQGANRRLREDLRKVEMSGTIGLLVLAIVIGVSRDYPEYVPWLGWAFGLAFVWAWIKTIRDDRKRQREEAAREATEETKADGYGNW